MFMLNWYVLLLLLIILDSCLICLGFGCVFEGFVDMCMYMFIYNVIYTNISENTHTYMHIYVYMYTHIHLCLTHTIAYTHEYIYIYIYTYIPLFHICMTTHFLSNHGCTDSLLEPLGDAFWSLRRPMKCSFANHKETCLALRDEPGCSRDRQWIGRAI